MSPITPFCTPGYACVVCRAPGPVCTAGLPDCAVRAGEPCAPGCPGAPVDPAALSVVIAETAAGPVCITRCAICAGEGRLPRLTADAAFRLAVEHRAHVAEVAR